MIHNYCRVLRGGAETIVYYNLQFYHAERCGKNGNSGRFCFLGSKISDWGQKIERKATANLDSMLKSRNTILLTKVYIVKAKVLPVVIYGCEFDHQEGWAPKNWCLQIVVLEKTIESPLDSQEIHPVNPRGNQPWIFINWKDWCWSWSFNTLATWCEEPTHWKLPWCWERLKAGGEEDNHGWDVWMASPNHWTWVWANSGRGWRTGKPGVL